MNDEVEPAPSWRVTITPGQPFWQIKPTLVWLGAIHLVGLMVVAPVCSLRLGIGHPILLLATSFCYAVFSNSQIVLIGIFVGQPSILINYRIIGLSCFLVCQVLTSLFIVYYLSPLSTNTVLLSDIIPQMLCIDFVGIITLSVVFRLTFGRMFQIKQLDDVESNGHLPFQFSLFQLMKVTTLLCILIAACKAISNNLHWSMFAGLCFRIVEWLVIAWLCVWLALGKITFTQMTRILATLVVGFVVMTLALLVVNKSFVPYVAGGVMLLGVYLSLTMSIVIGSLWAVRKCGYRAIRIQCRASSP